MNTRRKPRKRGHPLLLSREVEAKLVAATRSGVPAMTAAQMVGVHRATFQRWLQLGRDEEEARAAGEEPNAGNEPFLSLWEKVGQARAAAAATNVVAIQKVVQGGYITEEKEETQPDGTVIRTVKRQPPDWRAAAWMLERQHRAEFGKEATSLEISGPQGGPVELAVQVDAASLADRVAANIAALAITANGERAEDDGITDAELVDDDG